jgi:hypothetical protein
MFVAKKYLKTDLAQFSHFWIDNPNPELEDPQFAVDIDGKKLM